MSNQDQKPPKRKRTHAPPATEADQMAPASALPAPAPTDWITIGTIVATFGLRGEVKLLPQTDFPDRIGIHKILYLGPDHHPFTLLSTHPHGGAVLLRFAEITEINAAEKLRGLVVTIPQEDAAPLAPDQYYIHDLIGLRARHINGAALGSIADVLTSGAQDLLVVRQTGQPDVLVPLVKALVPTVDIAQGIVIIDPPGGLFDDDAIMGDE